MHTKEELARRLRLARLSAGINQEAAAAELGLPRPTISQIESGKRSVSGIELVKLAKLYHRPVASFFDDDLEEPVTENPLTILYRAANLQAEDKRIVEKFETFCRNYRELENILQLQSELRLPDYSSYSDSSNKLEAIRQGEQVALEERRRLGIGDAPVRDVFRLLEGQGVKLSLRKLNESGISGLFLYDRKIGPCILINATDHRNRLSFNAAHEYAHVLCDRRLQARVSTTTQQISSPKEHEEFHEVRANSFAAAFLMPASGIERLLLDRGMTRRSKHSLDVIHVLYLHKSFGVSYSAALYRLQNLGWIDKSRREKLAKCKPEVLGRALGLQDEDESAYNEPFPMRYVYLALQAYRQRKIKLDQLAKLLDKTKLDAQKLIRNLEIDREAGELLG